VEDQSEENKGSININQSNFPKTLIETMDTRSKHPKINDIIRKTLKSSKPKLGAISKPVKHEGWVLKKSRNLLIGWQKRYLILDGRKLKYHKGRDGKKLAGVIDFDLLTCAIKIEDKAEPLIFKVEFLATKRSFRFKTGSTEELKKWMVALNENMHSSQGSRVDLTKVAIQRNFWRYQRTSEQKFFQMADTGDILLFRGKSFGSKLQRAFTRSKYDHVAMILRYSNGKLVLLESTGTTGVALCNWHDFMGYKWHLLYSRLVYRHLYNERDSNMMEKLEKYVKGVIGKKYKISATKLFRKKSRMDVETQLTDEKGFFCSELVASAYKALGFLPSNISSGQYWPGAFSTEKTLTLTEGAYLGDEMLIDFSL